MQFSVRKISTCIASFVPILYILPSKQKYTTLLLSMSSSFAFVPRTLSKDKKKPGRNVHLNRSIPSLSAPTPTPTVNDRGKGKASDGKSKYSDEDYANVICIAISDYALWSDPDLRRTIDWSTRSESGQQANDACK